MKKLLLFSALALFSGVAFSATVTITNSGFAFSPDNISINLGDTVNFQLGGIHNAVEVSESTWSANGNTPLPGFSLPLGGGQVVGLTAGTHFYVCTPHASGGMKGKITVNDFSGTDSPEKDAGYFSIYPNPTNGKFTLQIKNSMLFEGNATIDGNDNSLEIYNLLGDKILSYQNFIPQPSTEIDLNSYAPGVYFVRIYDRKNIYTQRLILQ